MNTLREEFITNLISKSKEADVNIREKDASAIIESILVGSVDVLLLTQCENESVALTVRDPENNLVMAIVAKYDSQKDDCDYYVTCDPKDVEDVRQYPFNKYGIISLLKLATYKLCGAIFTSDVYLTYLVHVFAITVNKHFDKSITIDQFKEELGLNYKEEIIMHETSPLSLFTFKIHCFPLLENNTWSENFKEYHFKYDDYDKFTENVESFLWSTLRYCEKLDNMYRIDIGVYKDDSYYRDLHYNVYLDANNCTVIEDITKFRDIKAGDIVRHFKYNYLNIVNQSKNKYTYKVLGFAIHSESKEKMVVYEALYAPFEVYVRPYDMFMSEIDHEKYMNDDQVFRFYKVNM